jgi:hypothetical protein
VATLDGCDPLPSEPLEQFLIGAVRLDDGSFALYAAEACSGGCHSRRVDLGIVPAAVGRDRAPYGHLIDATCRLIERQARGWDVD